MRTITIAMLLLVSTAALAQPSKFNDRHPAYADDPPVRVVPIERIHTFEQRWEPVERLIREQAARAALTPDNAPVVTGAPWRPLPPPAEPQPRTTAKVADRAKDLCERHGRTKVWVTPQRWRCR